MRISSDVNMRHVSGASAMMSYLHEDYLMLDYKIKTEGHV